jgi:hypothetical protein
VKRLFFALLLLSSALGAQSLQYFIDPTEGSPSIQLTPLSTSFAFPDTPVGGVSSIFVRVVNAGTTVSTVDVVYIGASAGSSIHTANFSVTGFGTQAAIAPGSFRLFTLNFTPSATGISFGYLQAKVNGSLVSISTAAGNGTPPQVTLACSSSIAAPCTGATLQPSSAPIDFGNTLTTATTSIPFTLTNGSSSSLNPQTLVSLVVSTNNPNSPFQLSSLPATLDPGASVTFTVTFAPGTANLYQTTLLVGTSGYTLQGNGTANRSGDISSFVISYTDSTGVRLTAQPATPISFGQTVSGVTTSANTLSFSISNPLTTISAVSVSTLSVSGAGFAIASGPTLPASIAPGATTTFKLVFAPTGKGTYNGILAIGTRQFPVVAQSVSSAIPDPSFQIDVQPLVNQKQANLTISFPTPAPVSAIGTLSMSFTPSVSGVSSDPAVFFTATSGRTLQVTIENDAKVATYSGQSNITFQSGTTAGTLTFTLTLPNKAPYSQSFTISPAQVQVTSTKAVRQSPNLVITLTGYDNTYSLGQLGFTFYDTAGKAVNSKPLMVDAASSFKQYFFNNNQYGGAFAMQASFPVSGDVTQIGSVGIALTNSIGAAVVSPAFQ